MIPEIGLMIGAYIITRMIIAIAPPDKNGPVAQVIVAVFSILTIVVAAFVMYDLFARGATGIPGGQ
jgi:hypothetical protein